MTATMTDEDRFGAQVPQDGTISLPRWLSIRQIADDLGVSSSTAYKWSARGQPWFPRSIRLRNGDIRVRRDWYDAWLSDLDSERR
jgi:predicted DNA-binding transcriptional regulator AlpA